MAVAHMNAHTVRRRFRARVLGGVVKKHPVRKTLCLLVAMFATLGAAGPAAAITNGQPDGTRHPYVGMVTDNVYVCSGTLISPRLFVTAAHCFDDPGQNVFLTVDPDGFADDSVVVSGNWYPDPDFCPACQPGLVGFDTNDVAVVVLDSPIGVSRYASLPTADVVERLGVGQRLEVVGYGVQGFGTGGGPPAPDAASTRSFAPVQLVRAGRSVADEFIKVSADPSQGTGGICFGDSGGPVLLGDTILAVNSFVTNGLCRGITYSYRLDTADALEFISRF